MDDLSKLSTSLGGAGGAGRCGGAAGDPLTGLTGAIEQTGGLDGLVGKLRDGGLGSEVDSWVSTGTNQPVDPQRLGQALGPDTVQQLSEGTGIDIGSLLPLLAMFLPQIIDMLTPDGSTPSGGLDGAAGGGGMPDLGGLLGGLLGWCCRRRIGGPARNGECRGRRRGSRRPAQGSGWRPAEHRLTVGEAGEAGGRRSAAPSTTRPSWMSITRSARSISDGSCVATIAVTPSLRTTARNRLMIERPVGESS